MNMRALWLFCGLTSIAFCVFSISAIAGPEKSDLNVFKSALEAKLLNQSFTLRESFNVSGTSYFVTGTNEYICWQKPSGLFPVRKEVSGVLIVRIRYGIDNETVGWKMDNSGRMPKMVSIDHTLNYWAFTLKHAYLGKGEIKITTSNGDLPANMDEVLGALANIIKGPGIPERDQFLGQIESKQLHCAGCGHLTESYKYKPFGSLKEATDAGFVLCPLCFNHRLKLAHIEEEMEIGKQCEAALRYYHQMTKDPAMQSRVESVGRKVLANWPLPLKGYNYRFDVVDDRSFNAVACPGGYIFVNSGLLRAVENDDELEAVLAHEIAHVEQRHSIQEYLVARRSAQTVAALGMLAGVAGTAAAVSAHSRNPGEVGALSADAAILLMSTGAHIALSGYSRDHEIEADVYALIYLQKQGKSRVPLIAALKKVRSSYEMSNPELAENASGFDTHPNPKERLFIVSNLKCEPFKQNSVFDAYTKDGELLYTISLNALCTYTQRDGKDVCKLLTEVETTAALGKPQNIGTLNIRSGKYTQFFKPDGVIELEPMDLLGLSFTVSGESMPNLGEDVQPSFESISIQKVVQRAHDDQFH